MSGNPIPWQLDNGYQFYHIFKRRFLGKTDYTCTTVYGDLICQGTADSPYDPESQQRYVQHVKSHVYLSLYGNQPQGPGND